MSHEGTTPLPLEIVLHLGAHKTATTHLQLALGRARAALAGQGVAMFLPDDLRRNGLRLADCLSALPEDRSHNAVIRKALADAARGARLLLISEENILGSAHQPAMIREARLYPDAEARLARLRGLLPAGRVTITLAMRDPAGFLVSAYSQRLLSGRLEAFEHYRDGLDPAALSWHKLVARLRAAMPDAGLVLWAYEDYPAIAGQVLAAMLGRGGARHVRPGPGRAHPGLSAAAHAALMAEAPALADAGPEAVQARARALRRQFDRAGGHAPMTPLDEATRNRAAVAYAQEIARLAAEPGVRLLAKG
ncbi:MAG: hypothetical protein JJT95_10230 [Pararhodobacter sp.]|nr:hypothetical protein [Pararhodobacter sp.]